MTKRIKLLHDIILKSPQKHGNFKLCAKPSPFDERDYKLSTIIKYRRDSLTEKAKTNYLANMPPAWDQGQLGTCVAASSCWGFKAYEEIMQGDFPFNGLSVAYLYALCKNNDGSPSVAGTYPRIALDILQKVGVCTEDDLPYSWLKSDVNVPLPPQLDSEANIYKIQSYAQVCSETDNDLNARIDNLRNAIKTFGPLECALLVTQSFVDPVAPNYIIPNPSGSILGGHGVCLVDFDDWSELFLLRNTWGQGWGKNGYAYLPYEWVTLSYDPTGSGTQFVPFFEEAYSNVDIDVPIAAKNIQIMLNTRYAIVDGREVYLDQEAVIDSKTNRELVPLKFIDDNLGLFTKWNPDMTIEIENISSTLKIDLTVNSPIATVNGKQVTLDQPCIIDNTTNRALVPVRFIAESAGYKVDYNDSTKVVTLTK